MWKTKSLKGGWNSSFSIVLEGSEWTFWVYLVTFWLQTEINYLGQLRHPNLVRLIGYCLEEEHRLLVYEFMPRGSMENHLFRSEFYISKSYFPLSTCFLLSVYVTNFSYKILMNRVCTFSASFLGPKDEDSSWCCKGACFSSQWWSKSYLSRL